MANPLGNNGGRLYSPLVRPVLIDCNFIVDSTNGNGLGIRSLKGQGVRNVFMHTSASPGSNRGLTNPNPAAGYALIQLDASYRRYCGGFSGFVSPLSGSSLAINSSALTVGDPYVIVSPGVGPQGSTTIAPTGSDSSGSLASTYFTLYDAFGNTFVIWFYVTGVGGNPPQNVQGTNPPIQVTIAENATAAQQTTALAGVIALLNNSQSFTTSGGGTGTLTITSTQHAPLPGPAAAGVAPFAYPATYAEPVYATNLQLWQGVGLPAGVLPTVGASFIATAVGDTTGGTSTGLVQAPSVSGITSIEVIGDPNQTLGPIPMGGSPHDGGFILVQFLAPTNSSTTTPVPTAPAAGSVVGMSFLVEFSSVSIDGE